MRPNSSPSIPLSTLHPLDVKLSEGARAQIVCAVCGTFQEVKRGLVTTHHPIKGKPECSGSRQHLIFDVTPAQWATTHRAAVADQRRTSAALHEASRLTEQRTIEAASRHAIDPRARRGSAARVLVFPPVAPPVYRIAALRAAATATA
jgi:hypothetical protein